MKEGQRIIYVTRHYGLGVTRCPLDTWFVADVKVHDGDQGVYLRSIAAELREPDWHLTSTQVNGEIYYVPVHGAQFCAATPRPGEARSPELADDEQRLLATYASGPKIWDAATLFAVVARLEARGLITPTPDGRGAYTLTNAGRAALAGAEAS